MNPENLPDKFRDFRWFAERFFTIKDRAGKKVPFRFNALQDDLDREFIGRDDVLKARKAGCSTLIDLRGFHRALTRLNQQITIVAHRKDSAKDLFGIVKTAYECLPDQLRPQLTVDTMTEMRLKEQGSQIICQTARNADLGRGGTIHFLHCSEIAFWDDPAATLAGAAAAIGEDSEIYRESTANGAGSYWHQQWIKSKARQSGYKPHFYDWRIEPSYVINEPNFIQDHAEFDSSGQPTWEHDPNEEFEFTEKERQLEITAPQARWRRRKVKEHGKLFPQEYAEDDNTCFITSGASFFDTQMIVNRYEALAALNRKGQLVMRRNPELGMDIYRIWPKREWIGAEFAIGADTSEGLVGAEGETHGDFSHATIVEKRTGLQAASMHGIWEPYEFAHHLARAGYMFATPESGPALIGVERNEFGHAVLNELYRHIQYPNLYWHEVFDDKSHKPSRKLGFHTNAGTRPLMLGDLQKALGKGYFHPRDPELLAECLTFVRKRNGRPEAQTGCYDDRVMSAAITWQMRQVYSGVPLTGTNFR